MAKASAGGKGPSSMHLLAFKVLGPHPVRSFPLTRRVRENLIKAHLEINHAVYITSMIFWSVIVFVASTIITFLVINSLLPLVVEFTIPLTQSLIMSLLMGLTCGAVCFAIYYYYPVYASSNLRITLEKNLVYIANYMAILANAGATPGQTFSSLARVGEIYSVKRIARSIIKSVELLGQDIISAIDEESKRVPSREFADFLQGYIATLQTGGNLQSYLLTMAEEFMESRRRLLRKLIDQLNLAGELFVAALVALPVIMITILSVMGFFGGEVLAGLSAPQLMALMAYIFIPVTAVGVLIFIDAVMSSW